MIVAAGAASGRRRRAIAALGITQILAWGSSYYLPAVLAKPIVATTGWPYGWVIGGLSVGLLVSGLAAVGVGRAIDRHGGRPVLAASAILLATGLTILAAAPNPLIYLLAWLVLGLGMGAGLYDAAFSTLGRLYGGGARSAITSLTLWGGFASTACWPLSAALVEGIGWRGTCLVYAALHLAVSLPLHLLAIPGVASDDRPCRITTAIRPADPPPPPVHPAVFRLLATILVIGGTVSVMWSVHLIAILQAGGISLGAAVGLGALVGPAQVGARVVEMLTGGHHHPVATLAVSVVLIASGLALLWGGWPIPALALLSYGAGNGIWSIARGTLPLALFGASGFAVLMGRLAMPSLIAQSLAPSLGAMLMETYGASATLGVLTTLGVANVAGVAMLWRLTSRSIAASRHRATASPD